MVKYQLEKMYIFMCPSKIAIYVFSTMTVTTFKCPYKISVLIERVGSDILLQILWTISSIDVVSVERRDKSFAKIPMS